MEIDPDDRAATWEQLAQILRDRIADGEFRPGKRIPSISELAGDYRISPNTVKRALGVLKTEGLLEGVQGRGVFVADPLPAAERPAAGS